MTTSDFDFHLPPELIAQYPARERGSSRLLVVHRNSESWEDRMFADLPEYLVTGDLLVLNNTKVIPARLIGKREPTGAEMELLLLREVSRISDSVREWEVLAKPAKRAKTGETIAITGDFCALILEEHEEGIRIVRFESDLPFESALSANGHIPLPPYISRSDEAGDKERYQTVYASVPGAVAAPTAGLHFTDEIFTRLEQKGVQREYVLLHTGLGTFRPVETENIIEHRMHAEFYEVSERTANAINNTKSESRRVIAVGTTTVRVLETVADKDGRMHASSAESSIFIYPPYTFKIPDAMITNFHTPRSTLLMMISAFAGREFILRCYEHAIQERYRFFSYGDAMLIL